MTQKDYVRRVLTEEGRITSMEAFPEGITRLSDIIYKLRKEGLPIASENRTIKNRYGHPTTYSIYTLDREAASNE